MAQADYLPSLAHAIDSSTQPLRASRHPGVRVLPEYASVPAGPASPPSRPLLRVARRDWPARHSKTRAVHAGLLMARWWKLPSFLLGPRLLVSGYWYRSFFNEKRTDTKKHSRKLILRETTHVLSRREICGYSGGGPVESWSCTSSAFIPISLRRFPPRCEAGGHHFSPPCEVLKLRFFRRV
jgi:hypothetical protein